MLRTNFIAVSGAIALLSLPALAKEHPAAADPPTLAEQLSAVRAASLTKIPPEALVVMTDGEAAIRKSGLTQTALQVGQKAPQFQLPDHTGKRVASKALLRKGPVVLVFYRGGWCPFCNLQLDAMQAILPELEKLGATLVAVTPDSPDGTLESVGKHDLKFPVLTDQDNAVARRYGLVFALSPELEAVYQQFGIDLKARNQSDKSELPLAATYVIGSDGIVTYAFLDAAYYRRGEPADILRAVAAAVEE
jgi:peroxiredoxin